MSFCSDNIRQFGVIVSFFVSAVITRSYMSIYVEPEDMDISYEKKTKSLSLINIFTTSSIFYIKGQYFLYQLFKLLLVNNRHYAKEFYCNWNNVLCFPLSLQDYYENFWGHICSVTIIEKSLLSFPGQGMRTLVAYSAYNRPIQ